MCRSYGTQLNFFVLLGGLKSAATTLTVLTGLLDF
jgi:hypothetical protein